MPYHIVAVQRMVLSIPWSRANLPTINRVHYTRMQMVLGWIQIVFLVVLFQRATTAHHNGTRRRRTSSRCDGSACCAVPREATATFRFDACFFSPACATAAAAAEPLVVLRTILLGFTESNNCRPVSLGLQSMDTMHGMCRSTGCVFFGKKEGGLGLLLLRSTLRLLPAEQRRRSRQAKEHI